MTDTEMLDWLEKYGVAINPNNIGGYTIMYRHAQCGVCATHGKDWRDAIRAAVAEQKQVKDE